MGHLFNRLADIIRPEQTTDIIAVGDFYGKKVIVAVTDMNPRKEKNLFAGKCIASDCDLNPAGSYATNWGKSAFTFYHKLQ